MDWRKIEQLMLDWMRQNKIPVAEWTGNHHSDLDFDDVATLAHYLADNLKPEASKI